MTNDNNQVRDLSNGTVFDSTGSKIGSVSQVYLDDRTGEPAWVTVNTGLFGTSESFVPLAEATYEGENITVRYDKSQVKDAPRVDADQHLDREQEVELYRHYGLEDGGRQDGRQDGDVGRERGVGDMDRNDGVGAAGTAGAAGVAASGRDNDGDRDRGLVGDGDRDRDRDLVGDGDRDRDRDLVGDGDRDRGLAVDGAGDQGSPQSVARHEERLNVGVQSEESGRARLRKFVTTEEQTVSVPVRHEEVILERETIADPQVVDGDPIGEEEHEVKLHRERPVVSTETVEAERVRLGTNVVEGQEQVTGQVRKEHVEVDDGTGVRGDDARTAEGYRGDDARTDDGVRTDDGRRRDDRI